MGKSVRVGLDIEDTVMPKTEEDKNQEEVTDILTKLERQIFNLVKNVENIGHVAEYSKEINTKFHRASLSMNKNSLVWPMIQVMVLLVTGVIQARYLINFFKTKY